MCQKRMFMAHLFFCLKTRVSGIKNSSKNVSKTIDIFLKLEYTILVNTSRGGAVGSSSGS